MAEATTVTYHTFITIAGMKIVGAEWGNFTTGDTLTFTGAASVSTPKLWFATGKQGLSLASVAAASNVITFGVTSGVGSGYILLIGV